MPVKANDVMSSILSGHRRGQQILRNIAGIIELRRKRQRKRVRWTVVGAGAKRIMSGISRIIRMNVNIFLLVTQQKYCYRQRSITTSIINGRAVGGYSLAVTEASRWKNKPLTVRKLKLSWIRSFIVSHLRRWIDKRGASMKVR